MLKMSLCLGVAAVVPGATALPAAATDTRQGSHSCPSGRVVSISTYVNGGAGATDSHSYQSGSVLDPHNFVGGGKHTSTSPFQSASWTAGTSAVYYQGVTETCLN